jgi:Txe/YoeB family toxin of Txe-Axe toxin-antitoxin module
MKSPPFTTTKKNSKFPPNFSLKFPKRISKKIRIIYS